MGFLDKAKAAAEQAAAKAKEGVEDVQTKRELGQAYGDLGRATFELIESGELSHPQLDPLAEKVRTLRERAEDDGAMAGATAGASSDPAEPGPPPAMPN
jgi:hypothetical protein